MALAAFAFTAQDTLGNAIPGAQAEIRSETDNSLASLYADRNSVTPAVNPSIADSTGLVAGYVAPGLYKITITSGAVSLQRRYVLIDGGDAADRRTALGAVASSSVATSGASKILQLTSGGLVHYAVSGVQRLASVAVADDAVVVYDPPDLTAIYGALVMFKTSTNTQPHGMLWARCTTTPATSSVAMFGGVTPGYYSTALTGTTGTDGRINFGADDTGKFYIENRVGFTLSISAWLHI